MAIAAPTDDRNAALAEALSHIALGDRKALATLYKTASAHLLGVILRIQGVRVELAAAESATAAKPKMCCRRSSSASGATRRATTPRARSR